MIHIGDKYQLFRFDLNADDLNKLEETRKNPHSIYYEGVREPIFEYTEMDV